MEGVFATVDWLQIISAPLAVFTLIMQFALGRLRWRTMSNLLRSVCVLVATGLFAFHITTVAPRMNRHLHAYWTLIHEGRADEAQASLAAFNALHPMADGLLKTNLALLIVAIAASAVVEIPARRAATHTLATPDQS